MIVGSEAAGGKKTGDSKLGMIKRCGTPGGEFLMVVDIFDRMEEKRALASVRIGM